MEIGLPSWHYHINLHSTLIECILLKVSCGTRFVQWYSSAQHYYTTLITGWLLTPVVSST